MVCFKKIKCNDGAYSSTLFTSSLESSLSGGSMRPVSLQDPSSLLLMCIGDSPAIPAFGEPVVWLARHSAPPIASCCPGWLKPCSTFSFRLLRCAEIVEALLGWPLAAAVADEWLSVAVPDFGGRFLSPPTSSPPRWDDGGVDATAVFGGDLTFVLDLEDTLWLLAASEAGSWWLLAAAAGSWWEGTRCLVRLRAALAVAAACSGSGTTWPAAASPASPLFPVKWPAWAVVSPPSSFLASLALGSWYCFDFSALTRTTWI